MSKNATSTPQGTEMKHIKLINALAEKNDEKDAELRRLSAINAELIRELHGAAHTISSAQRGDVDQAWFIEALHSISSTLEKAKQ